VLVRMDTWELKVNKEIKEKREILDAKDQEVTEEPMDLEE